MAKFIPEFECTHPTNKCIYIQSHHVCIDPDAEEGNQVCIYLKVTRKNEI